MVDGDVASAGLAADETSKVNLPLVAEVAEMMGAGDMAIAAVRPLMRTVTGCSTLAVASGWLAVRIWVVHAGHAGAIELTLASLTGACGMIWAGNPTCSL